MTEKDIKILMVKAFYDLMPKVVRTMADDQMPQRSAFLKECEPRLEAIDKLLEELDKASKLVLIGYLLTRECDIFLKTTLLSDGSSSEGWTVGEAIVGPEGPIDTSTLQVALDGKRLIKKEELN